MSPTRPFLNRRRCCHLQWIHIRSCHEGGTTAAANTNLHALCSVAYCTGSRHSNEHGTCTRCSDECCTRKRDSYEQWPRTCDDYRPPTLLSYELRSHTLRSVEHCTDKRRSFEHSHALRSLNGTFTRQLCSPPRHHIFRTSSRCRYLISAFAFPFRFVLTHREECKSRAPSPSPF